MSDLRARAADLFCMGPPPDREDPDVRDLSREQRVALHKMKREILSAIDTVYDSIDSEIVDRILQRKINGLAESKS